MPPPTPTLHLVCGKIASGKSTLVARLGAAPGHVVIAEDDWLRALFADQMTSVADFVRCSARLRDAMGPHVVDLLSAGVSVVLDFQANTVEARGWMRGLLDQTDAAHCLHVLDVPDDVCLARLRARNAEGKHAFTVTEEQFWHITRHYAPPTADEGFDMVIHKPGSN